MKSQYSAIDNNSNFDGEIGADMDERGSIKSDDDEKPYTSGNPKLHTDLKEKKQNTFDNVVNSLNIQDQGFSTQ